MTGLQVWTVEIVLSEDDERTRADARLNAGSREFHAWGRARRSPPDPDVPLVGEELAASRALSELSHQLLDAAYETISQFDAPATSR